MTVLLFVKEVDVEVVNQLLIINFLPVQVQFANHMYLIYIYKQELALNDLQWLV